MPQVTLNTELGARCVAGVRRLGGSDRELGRLLFLGLRPQEASSPRMGIGRGQLWGPHLLLSVPCVWMVSFHSYKVIVRATICDK